MGGRGSTATLLLCAFTALLFAVHARASTVVMVDTTEKSYLPSLLVETRDLLGVLPDGERVTVYRLGQGWLPAFDDELDTSNRITLGQQLKSTFAVRGNPDWVAALTTGAAAARNGTQARVFIFTPDLSGAAGRGPYRGVAFSDLLKDEKLAPVDVHFYVRFLNKSPAALERENVRLLADVPDWAALLRAAAPPAAPPPPAPAPTVEAPPPGLLRPRNLTLAVLLPLALVLVLSALGARKYLNSAGEKKAFSLMARSSSQSPGKEGQAREEVVHRITRAGHEGGTTTTVREGDEVFLGDHFRARPVFSAGGCYVTVTQRKGVLEVENPSNRPARIGEFALAPRQRQRVPLVYFELVVGEEKLEVTRQVLRTDGEDAPAPNVKQEALTYER